MGSSANCARSYDSAARVDGGRLKPSPYWIRVQKTEQGAQTSLLVVKEAFKGGATTRPESLIDVATPEPPTAIACMAPFL